MSIQENKIGGDILISKIIYLSGITDNNTLNNILYYDNDTKQVYYGMLPESDATVSSVGLSTPNIFDVTNSPIIDSGNLTFDLVNQSQNTIFAGPSSGANTKPTFRTLVSDDLPTVPITKGGTNKTSFNNDEIHFGEFNQSANLKWDNTNSRLEIVNTTSSDSNIYIRTNGIVDGTSSRIYFKQHDSSTYSLTHSSFVGGERTSSSQDVIFGVSSTVTGTPTIKFRMSGDGNLSVDEKITAKSIELTNGFKLGTSTTTGYVLTVDSEGNGTWQAAPGSGGSSTFIGLSDTPSTFSTQSGKVLRVNSTEDALEFYDMTAGGTVTSVGLTLPNIFTDDSDNNPIETSGTFEFSLSNQSANTIFAGPADGSATTPSFRSLVANDLPTVPVTKGGTGVGTLTGIVIGNGISSFTAVSGTANQLLKRNNTNNNYEFFTISGDGVVDYNSQTGEITHSTTSGNKHIPSGGSSGQILVYSASGTAQWSTPTYLTSIKVLDTTNETTLSTNSTETISGTGTIHLHKISKTGNYNDLLNKPTIPSYQVLSYTDSTRSLSISNGNNITLPTFSTSNTNAGLVTGSNGNITRFLRGDNTWVDISQVPSDGTNGQLLRYNNQVEWWTPNYLTQNQEITLTGAISGNGTNSISTTYNGTVPVNKGGTNITSYTIGDILYASGTGTLSKRNIGTNGQVLTVVSGVPNWSNPTSTGVSSLISGNGLEVNTSTGDVTISLKSPLTSNGSTTNEVTSTGHSHEIIDPYKVASIISNSITIDCLNGLNYSLEPNTNFTINITNIKNGHSGDFRIIIPSTISITIGSLTAFGGGTTGWTKRLNGNLTGLTPGVYHLCWSCHIKDSSNKFIDFNIAKYDII